MTNDTTPTAIGADALIDELDAAGTATVEDGSIAKLALAGHVIQFEGEAATAPSEQAPAQPAAVAGPVAYRVLRKRHDGEWVTDGRAWCDGVPTQDLVDDIAPRSDGWRIEYAFAAPTTQATPQREVFDEDGFRAWVIRNLPDNTIIGNSAWLADHLAAWVQRFMLAAPKAAPVAQGDALTYEQQRAIRQGHEIAASDSYFDARPQIDNNDRRKVFEAGFERGWNAARAQAKEGASHG